MISYVSADRLHLGYPRRTYTLLPTTRRSVRSAYLRHNIRVHTDECTLISDILLKKNVFYSSLLKFYLRKHDGTGLSPTVNSLITVVQ